MANIYLVGFMATGKTSVGKELAKKLKWKFIDLDELIEFDQKMPIRDIFSKKGEPYFRKAEKRALKTLAKEKKFVVGCGGGIVIDKDNIQLMKDTGKIICLNAKPEVILKRAAGNSARPLLNVPNPKSQIAHLLKLRAPYYACADRAIDTSKFSIKQVVGKIQKMILKKNDQSRSPSRLK